MYVREVYIDRTALRALSATISQASSRLCTLLSWCSIIEGKGGTWRHSGGLDYICAATIKIHPRSLRRFTRRLKRVLPPVACLWSSSQTQVKVANRRRQDECTDMVEISISRVVADFIILLCCGE
uniref:Uncharacterized protein n=1 Tax=Ascaris lumbricoides TaxID=6252 RepID=A0A0M3ILJ1_ASCLU